MKPYRNVGGNSGIEGYEISEDSIKVQFKDGAIYLYTEQSTGRANIDRMKQLAIAGQGLRASANRRVAYVTRDDTKAPQSLLEQPSTKSCQPIGGASK